jgi:hypothetical protein
MVRKKEMTAAVRDLKEQLSEGSDQPAQTKTETDNNDPQPSAEEIKDASHPQIEEVERLLKEHGVDADELKGLAESFLAELKDLSAKKPLLTATGAFLLGFLAGRASRK